MAAGNDHNRRLSRLTLLPPHFSALFRLAPNRQKIAVNTAWLLANHAAAAVAAAVVAFWLTRHLGPEHFGSLMFAISFVALFIPFVHLGLEPVVVKLLVERPTETHRVVATGWWLQVGGGLLAAIAAVVLVVALFPNDPNAQSLVGIAAISLIPRAAQVFAYWHSALLQSRHAVISRIAALSIGIVARIAFILLDFPVLAFVVVVVIEAIVEAVLLARLLPWRSVAFWLAFDRRLATHLLTKGWPLWIGSIAVAVYMQIDQVMLKIMLGSDGNHAVGIYAPAVQVVAMINAIGVAMATSVYPAMIELRSQNPQLYERRLQQLYDAFTWLAIVLAAPLCLLSMPLARFAFGNDFADTGPVLMVTAWSTVFAFQGLLQIRWITVEGRQHLAQAWLLASCVLNVLLNLWFIPLAGPVGAAWATLLTQAATMLLGPLMFKSTRPLTTYARVAFAAPLRWLMDWGQRSGITRMPPQ